MRFDSKVSTTFFEKKVAKKTFRPVGFGTSGATAGRKQKFFGSFFQKRTSCLIS
jgi:hypothetical protein